MMIFSFSSSGLLAHNVGRRVNHYVFFHSRLANCDKQNKCLFSVIEEGLFWILQYADTFVSVTFIARSFRGFFPGLPHFCSLALYQCRSNPRLVATTDNSTNFWRHEHRLAHCVGHWWENLCSRVGRVLISFFKTIILGTCLYGNYPHFKGFLELVTVVFSPGQPSRFLLGINFYNSFSLRQHCVNQVYVFCLPTGV